MYDNALNITWSVDADADTGGTTWDDQVAWAAGLTLGGFTEWRLPSADVNRDDIVIDCSPGGVMGCEDNELGFLFHEEGISPTTPGPFSNLLPSNHWSETEFADDSGQAWRLHFGNGDSSAGTKAFSGDAWAVHDGNPGTAVVPVPAAVWLFGSALGLLGWVRRRRVN